MAVAFSEVRPASIKVRVLPRFPISLSATSPVVLSATGGAYIIELDIDALTATLDAVYANVASPTFSGTVTSAGPVLTTPVAVASLPAAAAELAGSRMFVTNATATTFASVVAGGGANGVPVYCDGTNWRIG